ncbi:saccharopine dehydrogenase NADP-binding domain-containing protein [Thalassotalea psychrophila]|uniref:Saccharopine dehydrogenase NADP-binding domain-containing protein n=1 Tax=Thalassotalea psychrophila TaxID=3065647 RepID=A0ABY9TZ33_9GAMM|nr:saccharopine dehydrogenase NADP-binding domain-containing protein [Colwelliaceae bacterium SQ149]
MNIILLGATGTTGQLVLEQLTKKNIKPILVGRSKEKLTVLSSQYDNLPIHIADAQNFDDLADIVNEGDLLISTVGPFNELGRIPVKVAIEKGAHYIDSNGEPTFITHVYNEYKDQLKNSNSLIMTSSGFDYVPGQFLGAKLANELDENVSTISIFYSNQQGGFANLTTGTISSLFGALTEKGVFYNDNKHYEHFLGAKSHTIKTNGKIVKGISVAGTEGYELPTLYPHLSNVNVYLGWFGKFGAMITGFNKLQHKLLKNQTYLKFTKKVLSAIKVPQRTCPKITAKDEDPSLVIAQAYDKDGKLIQEYNLTGHNMYYYTGEIMAWMASKIKAGEINEYGVIGPVRAFGIDELEKAHADIGFYINK